MDILHTEESRVIRVTIKYGEFLSDLVREYTANGWTFLNQYDGEHPEHGKVSYLRFTRSV